MRTRGKHEGMIALAERQHGIVSRDQLVELGYSPRAISTALASGRIHHVHTAVFAVGHLALSDHARCLAAVLARRDGALLSYRSAAWLWGIVRRLDRPVDVSVPWRGHSRPALHLHHCPALRPEDSARYEGIPVTAVARTLLDYASVVPRRALEHGVEQAHLKGHLDIDAIDQLLADVRGHAGRGKLRRAVVIYRDPAFSRSGGELRFLELLREAGIPRPRVNTWVDSFELDFYWEEHRFAVELDSWDAHRSRKSFEKDPRRQEDLKLAGIEMIRITGTRLANEPAQVAERLKILLGRRAAELGVRGLDRIAT